MNGPLIIKGDSFTDHRGTIKYFNTLNMRSIVRMYEIKPIDIDTVRAWQGHKEENKWFYCTNGKFLINLVAVDDFENPSRDLAVEKVLLDAKTPFVLKISGGFASGVKAIEPESKLLIFSNFTTAQSKRDDFRFDTDFWIANWN